MSFESLLKEAKITKKFEDARSASFESVPDGRYHCTLASWETGKSDKGVPYVMFKFTVISEAEQGRTITKYMQIEARKGTKNGKDWSISKEDCLKQICSFINSMGIDLAQIDSDELERVDEEVEAAIEDSVVFDILVKTRKGSDFSDVRCKGVLDDIDLPEDEDPEVEDEEYDEEDEEGEDEEGDDPEDDDDEEGDEDDDDEEDEEEEEDEAPWEPAKGEEVQYKVRNRLCACTVTTVSKRNQTVTLKRTKDSKVFKAVPWDQLIS